MSINLLKTGAWALIGGTAASVVVYHTHNKWLQEVQETNQELRGNYNAVAYRYHIPSDTPQIFLIGAIAGAVFKLFGIPAIQFLGSSALQIGRHIFTQRESFYNAIKWFFTK